MLFPSMDPNQRFRSRRDQCAVPSVAAARSSRALLLLIVLGLAGGMTIAGKGNGRAPATQKQPETVSQLTAAKAPVAVRPRQLPVEVRGVHVTGALASLPGKFQQYVDLPRPASTRSSSTSRTKAVRSDSARSASRWRRRIGAVRLFYNPPQVAALAHAQTASI